MVEGRKTPRKTEGSEGDGTRQEGKRKGETEFMSGGIKKYVIGREGCT